MLLVSPTLTMPAGSKHEKFFKGSLELPFCLAEGVNTPSHTADGTEIWWTTWDVSDTYDGIHLTRRYRLISQISFINSRSPLFSGVWLLSWQQLRSMVQCWRRWSGPISTVLQSGWDELKMIGYDMGDAWWLNWWVSVALPITSSFKF